MNKEKRRTAFTLAEVLITLTIIGVIAALTIPNLMQKWHDHADVQKVKEAYSILNNAIKQVASSATEKVAKKPKESTPENEKIYIK